MAYYEAIFGTAYSESDDVPLAVAEAMYHLSPVIMAREPFDVNIYGDDGSEQMLGVGIVFETNLPIENIEDCGAESVTEVAIEPA